MKFKKSMLILILAVFLISIAGVCASDVNDTQMASQENAAIESADENLITVEDIEPALSTASNEEILSEGVDYEIVGVENDLDELSANPGTYSGLSSEIGSGGDIALTHDYYTYDNGGTIVISIDNSVIDGNGAIIDMAGSTIRAFNVTASGVTIKNLTIKNANASGKGSAINFLHTGIVENCIFVNNNATDYYGGKGGAIYFEEGTGKVSNCNFNSNLAWRGAAICFNGLGNVENCNFTNNTAMLYGGAVFFEKDGVVSGCSFANQLAFEGGAVYFSRYGNVTYCNFTNNSANYGGAIDIDVDGNVENCIFINNSATFSGGAVYFYEDGAVKNCNFTNNSVYNSDGGAIEIQSEGIVENCIFVNNGANQNGGAILINDGEVTNCNFTNNSAGNDGAGVFINDAGIVENCIFINNNATKYGGAVYIKSGTVTNCNFTNNQALYGGATWLTRDATVENCIFVNNNATKYGGAIIFYEYGEVTNCNFTNNKAWDSGGGILFYESGEVTNCNFINNSGDYAGAVYIKNGGKISNSNFTNNSAGVYNGAVYINENGIVENCNFNGNNAPEGGAIRMNNSTVKNCSFNDNHASKGGAVLIRDSGFVSDCNFSNNSGDYGGAIFINENGIVENCNFIKNSAKDGGALFINGTACVTNCNFTDNKVNETQGHGDAIYWNGTNGNVSGCSFVNNSGYNGGTICWYSTDGYVSGCSFVNNTAKGNGGAIHWYGDNGNVSDCIFVNNSVHDGYGGAIWWQANDGVVSGCSFVNNSATNYGGAILWAGANGNVSGCSFVNNSAYGGSSIFLNGTYNVISDCIFANNSATIGGAIGGYECDNGVVSGCTFVNNSAGIGGAIYWYVNTRGSVSDCVFVNNSAGMGGAIWWFESSRGVVSSCIFLNNSDDNAIVYINNKQNYASRFAINDNIFLNNDGVAVNFRYSDSTSNADYNWFGHNATNYDIKPLNNNAEISTWLFLNATADPDSISVSESSDILFKLYSYSSAGISDYDNSKLPVVNLTLTANNGNLNERTVALGNPVEFTPNGVGNASVTAAIENAEYTILLDVAKADSILSADNLVMAYKDGSKWNVTLTDSNGVAISGRVVKIGIKDKIYSIVTDENGVAGLPINLIPDTYAINATFEGDGDYGDSFVNATVTVNKAVATLSAVDLEMAYKDGSAWSVTLTDLNGDAIVGVKVAIGICNKTYHIKTNDEGAANLTIKLLPGTYDINASFSSSRYEAQTITATVTINKLVPTLSAEDLVMNYKDGSAWNVTLKDAAGNIMANTTVKFTIGNKTYNRKTNADGVASLPIGLAVGNYTISAEFEGTRTLDAVSVNSTIVVNSLEYNLVANDINMTYQDGTNYTVQITDGDGNPVAKAGVVIKMTINEKSYNRKTNEEGIASLPIGLRAGTYPITAEYNGRQITNTIVVNKA